MNKPQPIEVDNEIFKIEDERALEPLCLYVSGPNLGLSPYEVMKLRDWLTECLEWFDQEII